MISQSDLKEIVRSTGLKSTPSRVAVLRTLSGSSTPFSHAELVVKLADLGFDRATIFRNLTDLTEVGLLSRIDVGDHIWRFELKNRSLSDAGHPHFVCTDCGEVECLPELDMQVTSKVGSISEVLLKGHCEECEE